MIKLISALVLFIFIPYIMFADDGYFHEIPKSGTVIPLRNYDIQMLSELVIYSNYIYYASFVFTNTSSKTNELLMGFPMIGKFNNEGVWDPNNKYLDYNTNKDIIYKFYNNYYNFKCFYNNVEIKSLLKEVSDSTNLKYKYIFSWKLKVLPYKSFTISNVYNQYPDNEGNSIGQFNTIIQYILSTGSLWYKNIKTATLIFYIDEPRCNTRFTYRGIDFVVYDINPNNNYLITSFGSNNALCIKLNYTNIKPYFDIDIRYRGGLHEFNYSETDITNYTYTIFHNQDTLYKFITNINYDMITNNNKSYYNMNNTIQFIINCFDAIKGYKFQKGNISAFFKQFKWYNPSVIDENKIIINSYESNMLLLLKSYRNAY